MHLNRLCSVLLALSTMGTLLKRSHGSQRKGSASRFLFHFGDFISETVHFCLWKKLGFQGGDREMCSAVQALRKQVIPDLKVMRLDLKELEEVGNPFQRAPFRKGLPCVPDPCSY